MLPDLDVGGAFLAGQLINIPVSVRMKPTQSEGEREEEDAFESPARAWRSVQGDMRRASQPVGARR